ncbi:MAG: aldose epimerase family protein [Ferruginibacter sp.]
MNSLSPASIQKTLWADINGKGVWIFCLKNNKGTRIYLSNYGATAQSLFFSDRNGVYDDILLGYESLPGYLDDTVYMGCVVGRYANRIAGGEVVIDGKKHTLATRDGGYHLHGGNKGFNKKIFDFEIGPDESACSIKFTCTSKDMEEGYPGKLQLEIIYTLDEDDSWIVEYKATTNKSTILNLTQHAYFNLSGHTSNSIDDHELKINSQYYLPVNEMQVPTGEYAEVRHTAFDFTKFKKIGSHITDDDEQLKLSNGYDHSFVLEKQHTHLLKHAAVVKDAASGRRMDVYTTEPAVHFYSGNFLENIRGKNDVIYASRSGFCLETQHFPDAPNHPHFPSTILKAGEQFYSKTVFKFSVDKTTT